MTPTPDTPFIYLATPCYGGQVELHYMRSVLDLQVACARSGVGLHVELLGDDSLITRARARLLQRFLDHPRATHLLFCDADIGFAPQNALRLLASGKDVVAGVCPLKAIDWDQARAAAIAGAADLQIASVGYVVRFIPTPDNSVEVHDGIARVAYVGTGFLMISRSAAAQVCAAHPELNARLDAGPGRPPESVTMIFEALVEPETGFHLSEDYAFCRRWQGLGGEIWADMESSFTHSGPTTYTGNLMQAMRAG